MATQEGEDTWGSPLLRRGIYCLAVRESFHVWLHCAWTSCKQNQNKTKQKTPENNPKRSTKKNSNVNYRTYHKSKDGFRSTSHQVESGCWRWGAAATDQNSCLLVKIYSLKNKCYKSLTFGLQTPCPRVHRTIGLAK